MSQTTSRAPALGFIFITLLIDVTGFGIIIPVMPKLLSSMTGCTLEVAADLGGWLMFAFSLAQFLCAPIMGGLSDRFGRRPVLLASLFGFGIDYLFLALAPTVAWLFVGRAVAGVMGASFTTAQAYVADVSPPEKRAQNFGIMGAAFGIGFILGPVIGGLLGSLGPRVPFYAAAALSLINWLYGFFILPESLGQDKRRAFDWKRANPVGAVAHLRKYPALGTLVASFVCIFLASHAVQSTWSYFVMYKFSWTEDMVGYSLGVAGLLVGIVQALLIRTAHKLIGPQKSIYAGLLFYTVSLTALAFANSTWMMYVLLVPYCMGALAGPSMQSMMSAQVPANEQGELQGALTGLISLTSILGPPLMTNLFSTFSSRSAPVYFPGAPFLVGAMITLVGVMIAAFGVRNLKNPAPLQGAAATLEH